MKRMLVLGFVGVVAMVVRRQFRAAAQAQREWEDEQNELFRSLPSTTQGLELWPDDSIKRAL